MHRLLTRASLSVAIIIGSLLTGGAAYAEPAPMVRVVLESFTAYDLEESGHDEVYVIAQYQGKARQLFPTNTGELSVARNDCIYISGDSCPAGTNHRGYYSAHKPSYTANGTLLMVALREDDIAGDDTLINVPLWPEPISETQYFREEANINGYHYTLNFRLEPSY
ncbi:hypothetical protein [Streptosporangium roseum]|uniref:Uncharacterized protein n=1 Tax=Streptosporangium roseum (strain ATCC 12428 / DSM 43021 / JCM 3005 / KCTC 9067 / NCIMB 10171 / NRRL 2505 / NI 9100) TaxID=479432 RepID=D2B9I3_STRRD|nr:hypothetical protein [Streptosporangium roseum]ACZ83989.1 hypothetical protein Sros_0988 [Streptosporangium roseum DSM 43021]